MSKDFESSIIRIVNEKNETRGTGFLVNVRLAVTCAHVVRMCHASPGEFVWVAFQADNALIEAKVIPEWWDEDLDIAFLQLISNPPPNVAPLQLKPAVGQEEQPFRIFGYPNVAEVGSMHGAGVMRGLADFQGRRLVQLHLKEIVKGFSGSPVLVGGAAVAMLSLALNAERSGPLGEVAYAIPAEALISICSEVEIYKEDPAKLGELHNVPRLPEHYLPRQEELAPILAALLGGKSARVGISAVGKVGVQGMGGIGKSVLAAALACDPQVRQTYPDGIVWLSIGQEPNLTTRQMQLADCLTGTAHTFHDPQHGKTQLESLFKDKTCLLILDDVWDFQHVTAFDCLASGSKMLLTSRHADLIQSLRANLFSLDVLSKRQSLALLSKWAGQQSSELPPEAIQVARQCGYLPLALAMVGALVQRNPESWESALHRLKNADLSKIRANFSDYPYPDLLRAIQASVTALPKTPLDLQSIYLGLAVFPEDTPIPQETLQTYWSMDGFDKYDVQDVIESLISRSLAGLDNQRRLTLHDLQHDYLRAQATNDLGKMHDRLLQAYIHAIEKQRPDILTIRWHYGPNDGYYFQHLVHHLVEAGHIQQVNALLITYEWLEAKLYATDPNALVSDYAIAIRLATKENKPLNLIQSTIRLSTHILTMDKNQFRNQLWGRLAGFDVDEINKLLATAKKSAKKIWLRPLNTSLEAPGGALERTMMGHAGPVRAVAVSPSGQIAVSASSDHTLKIWSLESGIKKGTLGGAKTQGHSGPVRAVAITPDGRSIVSGSEDKLIKIWNLRTTKEYKKIKGHSGAVHAVAITPDGKCLISASEDKTLKMWDLSSGDLENTFYGHSRAIRAAAITRDGKRCVSASDDHTLRVWNLKSGAEEMALCGHTEAVRAVAVTPDGQHAISGSSDNTLKIWNLLSGAEEATLKGHRSTVWAVKITADGRQAISASSDRTINIWNLGSRTKKATLRGHSDWVWDIALTPDGKRIVSVSDDRTLKVWDARFGIERENIQEPRDPNHKGPVRAIAITGDGKHVLSASSDHTIKIWDIKSGALVNTLRGHTNWVRAIVVTPDNKRVISASSDHTIKIYNLTTGDEEATLTGHKNNVFAIATIPGSCNFITGSKDRTLKIWDINSNREEETLIGHARSVRAVAVTPDGSYAISASNDGTFRIWNLKSHTEERIIKHQLEVISALAVTPDGQRFICASNDQSPRIWNLASGQEEQLFRPNNEYGHLGPIKAVAIAPNGNHCISASEDGSLILWDQKSGEPRTRFRADQALLACAISPDNCTFVAGEAGGRVYFLQVEWMKEEEHRL